MKPSPIETETTNRSIEHDNRGKAWKGLSMAMLLFTFYSMAEQQDLNPVTAVVDNIYEITIVMS